ncbi:MAG TPA: hypothetical protein VHP63_03315, partial [candidate division Zixibacteria bacterium]|nr:hypothetical protein [candidate division Zixibacteria bacterium]
MKRKAPPHGKKESAAMQSGAAKNLDSSERRSEKRTEDPNTKPNEKVEELRKKIRSGFYESKEVM